MGKKKAQRLGIVAELQSLCFVLSYLYNHKLQMRSHRANWRILSEGKKSQLATVLDMEFTDRFAAEPIASACLPC